MILPSTVEVPFIVDVTYFLNFDITPNSKVLPTTIVPFFAINRIPEHIIAFKYDYIIDTREELEFDSTKTASEYFKINRTNIACVLSEKNKAKQFYVGDNRYVQKLPKTRDWNFDIPYVKRNQL